MSKRPRVKDDQSCAPFVSERVSIDSPSAPATEKELLDRAHHLAGLRFEQIAKRLNIAVPDSLMRAKGWVGQLLEEALGADASTRSEPDFVDLGVELKSIPVDAKGRPRETTFVCTASLTEMSQWTWSTSRVYKKISRVLWIPVEADPSVALAQRRVGHPLLWSPNPEEEAVLRSDWEGFSDRIAAGYVETITGSEGKVLHMRPKGANAAAKRWGLDSDGAVFRTRPKGFYLRTHFTAGILDRNFLVSR